MRRIGKRTERALIQAYRKTGDGGRTLAAKFGVGATTLYRVLRRNGIRIDPKKMKVPGSPRWKFSLAQSGQIAKLYAKGVMPSVLAKQFDCSPWTVRNAVRRHGLGLLRRGGQLRPWSARQRQDILRRGARGETQESIASRYQTNQTTVSRILRMAGRETRRMRERHGNWKGGRAVTSEGYVMVLVDDADPCASMRMGNGYILEHRLVMARKLGRPLLPTETAHHINGDKADNRPENLQLRVGRHGKGVVVVCADCGSRNLRPMALGEGGTL